jgi:hypothetical protein
MECRAVVEEEEDDGVFLHDSCCGKVEKAETVLDVPPYRAAMTARVENFMFLHGLETTLFSLLLLLLLLVLAMEEEAASTLSA